MSPAGLCHPERRKSITLTVSLNKKIPDFVLKKTFQGCENRLNATLPC